MLSMTRKSPPDTSAHKYLNNPDVNNNQWCTNGKGETNVILCDKEILLTEELRTYLLYFAYMTAGKNLNRLHSFSNLPIKEN
jgi:hypothetical protein